MEDVVINIGGFEVLISACDVERVKAHGWYKCSSKGGPYFAYKTPSPEHKNVFLHRFIISCPAGMQVDHVNGNTLDNRRENLRICSQSENCRNVKKLTKNTSGYKGVSWHKRDQKWVAQIGINKKRLYLGSFDTPEEAYEAYVAASKKYHGEFGRIA